MARVVEELPEGVEVARISELVEVGDLVGRLPEELTHQGGADKTGAAGDEKTQTVHRP